MGGCSCEAMGKLAAKHEFTINYGHNAPCLRLLKVFVDESGRLKADIPLEEKMEDK